MFYIFHSQEERRAFYGGAMLEMQFCKMNPAYGMEELVAVDNIAHWQDDSLYVADENLFYQEYGHIFTAGVYNNLASGPVDLYGINYYAPEQTASMIEKIRAEKPCGYELLTDWLEKSRAYNGFYILGL